MVANFLLFGRFAIIEERWSNQQCFKTELTTILWNSWKNTRFKFSRNNPTVYSINTIILLCPVLSFLLYTFFFAVNITVYTPNQGTNREKYFYQSKSKLKCRLWREINSFSMHLFSHRTRPVHLSGKNGGILSVRDGNQSAFSRADFLYTSEIIYIPWLEKDNFFYNQGFSMRKE